MGLCDCFLCYVFVRLSARTGKPAERHSADLGGSVSDALTTAQDCEQEICLFVPYCAGMRVCVSVFVPGSGRGYDSVLLVEMWSMTSFFMRSPQVKVQLSENTDTIVPETTAMFTHPIVPGGHTVESLDYCLFIMTCHSCESSRSLEWFKKKSQHTQQLGTQAQAH